MSQAEVYYQAMLARDYRFDGKFFVGVKTTGVYCRPICPARPKRENVEFFATSALSEKAGYRPCLRCRPECAPLSPAWYGKSAVVQRALKQIATNQLVEMREDEFAAQFGMSARHLRRLFEKDIGRSPKQVSDNHRLNFAGKLIVETRLPMTIVAETAGFASLRRFNDAFKKRFSRAPTELRRKPFGSASVGWVRESTASGRDAASEGTARVPSARPLPGPAGIELALPFRPPFDWETILHYFDSHKIPGLETVHDHAYSRIFELEGEVGWLQVRPAENALKLRVVVDNPRVLFAVVARVRRMFDLDSDPLLIANRFSGQPLLAALHVKFPGLRVPRAWDAFESVICAILGQLVSVEQGRRMVGQLVEGYGEKARHPVTGEAIRLFPSAKVLASADLSAVKSTLARKATIREFSRRVLNREIHLSDAQEPALFRERLLDIKGIGPWSAECICLRALGDADAFPATDLILGRALALHPGLDVEAIKPWRGYAATYLWQEFASTLSKRKGSKS